MDTVTIGMDLGDKNHVIYVLNSNSVKGNIHTIGNERKKLIEFFKQYPKATVAFEAGTHSPWISRQLSALGCNVLIGNPRKLRVIWDSDDKDDLRDAEMLARVARFDPALLYPIQHRGEQAQMDLELLKARDMLVKSRASLINHVRGAVKAVGARLPSCSTPSFHNQVTDKIPVGMEEGLQPLLSTIGDLTTRINEYDRKIAIISQESYPETVHLREISGVGPLTSLAFLLILEEHNRFKNSRQVGKFLGLTPRKDQSGETDKQLRITKAGNVYLRKLLVQAAHYILGPFGPPCNLRSFGLRLAERGGKNARRRAVVAVARKLAVLMHRLWKTGEVYDPFYNVKETTLKAA